MKLLRTFLPRAVVHMIAAIGQGKSQGKSHGKLSSKENSKMDYRPFSIIDRCRATQNTERERMKQQ